MSELLLYPAKLEEVVVPDELRALAKLGRQLLDIASFEASHPEITQSPHLQIFDEVPEMSRALWRLPTIGNQYNHEYLAVMVVNTALIISINSLKPYMENRLMGRTSLVIERNVGRINESEPLRPVSSTTRLPNSKFDYFTDRLGETLNIFEIELPEIEMREVG